VNAARAIPVVAVLVVIAAVIAAFIALGPPGRARARALDRQRIADLRSTAAGLHNQYRTDAQLLGDRLADPKRDPITHAPYEYERIDATHYRLCAGFELKSDPDDDVDMGQRWKHGAGRTCYRFDVRRAPP
jgi:hypothetical protein